MSWAAIDPGSTIYINVAWSESEYRQISISKYSCPDDIKRYLLDLFTFNEPYYFDFQGQILSPYYSLLSQGVRSQDWVRLLFGAVPDVQTRHIDMSGQLLSEVTRINDIMQNSAEEGQSLYSQYYSSQYQNAYQYDDTYTQIPSIPSQISDVPLSYDWDAYSRTAAQPQYCEEEEDEEEDDEG